MIQFTTNATGVDNPITNWCPSIEDYNVYSDVTKLCMHLEFIVDDLNLLAAAGYDGCKERLDDNPRTALRFNIANAKV